MNAKSILGRHSYDHYLKKICTASHKGFMLAVRAHANTLVLEQIGITNLLPPFYNFNYKKT